MKITLQGLRNVPLAVPYEFSADGEYLIPLLVSRESIELHDSQNGEPPESTIKLRVIRVSDISRVGSKEVIKVVAGKTKSQILRFAIMDMLDRLGEARTEENYEAYMVKLTKYVNEKGL